MAPSSGTDTAFHKHYFDDPTLSDLTLRLSDRAVYVHRIVLCRRSAYFEKLTLGGFKVCTAGARLATVITNRLCRKPALRKSSSTMTTPTQ